MGFRKFSLALLIMVAAVATGLLLARNKPPTPDSQIPQVVLAKYDEVRSAFSSLSLCKQDNDQVFAVTDSGGYSFVTYYYSLDGRYLGSAAGDDKITGDEAYGTYDVAPPIPIESYDCKLLEPSKE